MTQKRLDVGEQKIKYSYGPYNKSDDKQQWIRISEGCPHNCPWCYEPTDIQWFGIPDIIRNDVKIMDMNMLAKPRALSAIKELGEKRVNGKVVHYEFICGIDHRFLTQEIANAMKESRFRKLRLAWDWFYKDQHQIKDAITKFKKAGYKSKDIMVFMICNHKIKYKENLRKLDLCKVWKVLVADCYYDNQVAPNIVPVHWTSEEIKKFRRKSRKHNQLVNFEMDPQQNIWAVD